MLILTELESLYADWRIRLVERFKPKGGFSDYTADVYLLKVSDFEEKNVSDGDSFTC